MKQHTLWIEKEFLLSLVLLKENRRKMGYGMARQQVDLVKRSSCEIISLLTKHSITFVSALLLFTGNSHCVTTPQCFNEYGMILPCFLLYSSHFILHLTLTLVAPYTCALQNRVHIIKFWNTRYCLFSVSCFSILCQLNVSFCFLNVFPHKKKKSKQEYTFVLFCAKHML